MSGIARSYPLYKGFCPSWNWSFALTIEGGGEVSLPAFHQVVSGGGGGGGGAMAPAAGDPPPENAIFEPGRWMMTSIIRTTDGLTYIYVYWQMEGGTRHQKKFYVNHMTAIQEMGVNPVLRLPQVDYWWITILNRSDVNPASVEGAVSIYARGFL